MHWHAAELGKDGIDPEGDYEVCLAQLHPYR